MCLSMSERRHRGSRGVRRTGTGNLLAALSFQIVRVAHPTIVATSRTDKYSACWGVTVWVMSVSDSYLAILN